MRKLNEITDPEIKEINDILKQENYRSYPLKTHADIEYQCFNKTCGNYTGYTIVRIYNYLIKIGIDILTKK